MLRQNKIGGRLCIFSRDDLKFKLRNDLVFEDDADGTDNLFIEIINEKSKNIIIGTLYRPPNNRFNKFDNNLKTILTILDKCNKPCYIWVTLILIYLNIIIVISQLNF